MEKKFWEERYSEAHYVYGKEPNEFFKQEIESIIPGKLLLPGEGEGRNAVYAALKGWDVTAYDFSEQAKAKAMKMAKEKNVKIDYLVSSLEEVSYKENEYDLAALIFVHFPSTVRERAHKAIVKALKTGGTILIEAFNKKQIENNSGGPKDKDSLYSIEDFRKDFMDMKIEMLYEHHTDLSEGHYHKGPADVIRFKGVKRK